MTKTKKKMNSFWHKFVIKWKDVIDESKNSMEKNQQVHFFTQKQIEQQKKNTI